MKGIEQIDIFFDPDDAGQQAVEKVKELCDSALLKYFNIVITNYTGDAGDLNENQVIKLKEMLYGS